MSALESYYSVAPAHHPFAAAPNPQQYVDLALGAWDRVQYIASRMLAAHPSCLLRSLEAPSMPNDLSAANVHAT